MTSLSKVFSICMFVLLCSVAKLHAQKDNDLYLQTSEMNDLMVHFDADHATVIRFYSAGRNNNTNTPERRQRLLKLADDYLVKMAAMNFDGMNINGKVDYILFRRKLEDEKYRLTQEDKNYQSISKWLPFSDSVYNMIKPRRRGWAVNGQDIARRLNDVSKQIKASIADFKKADSLDAIQGNSASDAITAMQGVLKDYYNFYNGYDPMFTWWVPKTYSETDSLLGAYANAMKKKSRLVSSQKDDGSGIIGNPIGREELIRQLKIEFIPYSPEELIEIANKEFSWCDAELLKATKEMGFGDNWKAAQEKVKNTYVEPGRQPEAMYDLYRQSVDFLRKHDLVTIDSLAEEGWGMYMMSPERQLVAPFFLGGESLLISYPTNTMSYDDKMMSMRGNNPNFSRATVHHELLAGHHLQGYSEDRYKAYRHFDTPFWTEGNALYWEFLLWDLKFPRTPEERLGMLFWRKHRCARIIFSLNYHLGKWTPQQCIDFLVDRVGHERANAEGEVRRSFTGGYGPLYQIAYMLGGLQFWALKKELVDSKKMSYRQYHDAILHENAMPVEMLRALLTKQPLTRDFSTQWKFYDK